MAEILLEAKNLKKSFRSRENKTAYMHAVQDVSFQIEKGECLGLIGESGCGKSTTAYMAAGLLKPDEGEIIYHINHWQMVFQDPMKALNPRMKILDCICEGMMYHRHGLTPSEIRERALEMMDLVQLDRRLANRRSKELSGGECQRATIARAILVQPKLLICDEVTSALDVSVQAQIMMLLDELKKKMDLSMLFISHDIALVSNFCDRVAVMYQGRIIETGKTMDVIHHPKEAYTKKLIASVLTL